MNVYPVCDDSNIALSNGNKVVKCVGGWSFEVVPDGSGGGGTTTIDYMSSGTYFGAAFTVCAVIVLTAKVAARLLNFIRR